MLVLTALLAALLTGCGLPLTDGVQSAGEVSRENAEPVGIQVLPPGPQPGATAVDLVRGFLRAQSSPDDAHAVARQFLAPGVEWDDEDVVVVYAPGSQIVRVDPDDPERVEVRLKVTARIAPDGAYRLEPADTPPPPDEFRVGAGQDGRLLLTEVPTGLRLASADVPRSYAPQDVFMFGDVPAVPAGTDPAAMGDERLVPDRVFLPVTVDPASALVRALLRGPSLSLAPAVRTAVPEGTTLTSPVVTQDGVVTVDLSEQTLGLDEAGRRRLAAQVVWTLQDYTGVRLLSGGRPLDVGRGGQVQTRDDWSEFDPAGTVREAPLYYVQGRKLVGLDASLPAGEATRPGPLQVDAAAVNPATGRLAVLTRDPTGEDQIRIGPVRGVMGGPVFARPELGSLSWGSGERGLWLLERAVGDAPARVWLLPLPAEGKPVAPQEVLVEMPVGAGPLTQVTASRDGARVALVFGQDESRQLYVGRVQPAGGGGRIADVVPVAPGLSNVTDVAWETGTSLVVLASDSSAAGLLTLTVAVDGSSAVPLQRQGVEGVAQSVAAAPGRPLVVAAAQEGQATQLFVDDGVLLRPQAAGAEPFYPG